MKTKEIELDEWKKLCEETIMGPRESYEKACNNLSSILKEQARLNDIIFGNDYEVDAAIKDFVFWRAYLSGAQFGYDRGMMLLKEKQKEKK